MPGFRAVIGHDHDLGHIPEQVIHIDRTGTHPAVHQARGHGGGGFGPGNGHRGEPHFFHKAAVGVDGWYPDLDPFGLGFTGDHFFLHAQAGQVVEPGTQVVQSFFFGPFFTQLGDDAAFAEHLADLVPVGHHERQGEKVPSCIQAGVKRVELHIHGPAFGHALQFGPVPDLGPENLERDLAVGAFGHTGGKFFDQLVGQAGLGHHGLGHFQVQFRQVCGDSGLRHKSKSGHRQHAENGNTLANHFFHGLVLLHKFLMF